MSFDTIVTATSTALVNISATAQALPWPALLWMGLATTSFTLWIEFIALRNVSASTCALIYTTEPLWGRCSRGTSWGTGGACRGGSARRLLWARAWGRSF